MQRDLQIALIIIGGLVIIGILLHGFWTTRKQKAGRSERSFQSRKGLEPKFNVADDDEELEYDDVIISPARVIEDPARSTERAPREVDLANTEQEYANEDVSSTKIEEQEVELDSVALTTANDMPLNSMPTSEKSPENQIENEEPVDESSLEYPSVVEAKPKDTFAPEPEKEKAPIYSGVVTQPKPEFVKAKNEPLASDDVLPEPPSFLLKKQQEAEQKAREEAAREAKQEADKKEHEADKKEHEVPEFTLDAVDAGSEAPSKNDTAVDINDANSKMPEKPKKAEKEFSFAEQAKRLVRRNKKTLAEKIRKEPILDPQKAKEDQMRIDFGDQPSVESRPSKAKQADSNSASQNNASAMQSDVIILNVQTPSESPISGATLLPMLLTLGFKFGEHDIFHRHVNTNGKGPILFSLTNMFKPGVFDIDNIENFNTQGVSLFMMLPIDGDPQQVFNMMHNAARKISEEFGGKILDGNKVPISKQSLQQYAERIREFERRRLSR